MSCLLYQRQPRGNVRGGLQSGRPKAEPLLSSPHPLVAAAARGQLPDWAVAGKGRRSHMARVASLLEQWGHELGLQKHQIARWRAAGYLHDALREVPPEELEDLLSPRLRRLPVGAWHGPAAAAVLRSEGVRDRGILRAIRWHTVGSRKFGRLGKALYAADALEPGRTRRVRWRERLRARIPVEMDAVLGEILSHRICYLIGARQPVHPRTLGFWNSLVDGS